LAQKSPTNPITRRDEQGRKREEILGASCDKGETWGPKKHKGERGGGSTCNKVKNCYPVIRNKRMRWGTFRLGKRGGKEKPQGGRKCSVRVALPRGVEKKAETSGRFGLKQYVRYHNKKGPRYLSVAERGNVDLGNQVIKGGKMGDKS